MSWITEGTLYYSPKMHGDHKSEKWWLIVQADLEIGRYYRKLYHYFRYRAEVLMPPAWREHVTVIRNEEPPNETAWEKYAGEMVEFEVLPVPDNNGDYFWLEVVSPRLLDIREELGLPRPPLYDLHLSFGHRRVHGDS